jgi:hypothetical protein
MGFTGYNNELLVDIRDDGMAETRYLNNRGNLDSILLIQPSDIYIL